MTILEFNRDLENSLNIYEEITGKRAARTRQMIDAYGTIEALSKLMITPNLQVGFKKLRDEGKLRDTFEAITGRHSELFKKDVVESAKWRLDNPYNLL